MKRKLLSIIGFTLFFSMTQSKLQAQEVVKYANGVGVAAGFTTGYGLSYRYFPGPVGVQLTFAPYSDPKWDQFSTGVTLLYNLMETDVTTLYLYQGTHYFYQSRERAHDNMETAFPTQRIVTDYVNVGLGVGTEVVIARRVGLNLMAGYAAYNTFRKLNLTAETGVYYKF